MLNSFPPTVILSDKAREALQDCIKDFARYTPDKQLIRSLEAEYKLFCMLERRLYENEISRLFRSVDDFLNIASRIMNRRKARAGHSLENHVLKLLTEAEIPFTFQPRVDGNPDVIIPGCAEYKDPSWPTEKLCVLAVKRTCKDRWRQITREARRVPHKHLLTIQNTISIPQLAEMNEANVTLVVPKDLQRDYPRNRPVHLLTIEQFIDSVRTMLR